MSQDPDQADRRVAGNLRKTAFTSLVGTSIEFYDFFIFGTAAALVFPTVFFPAEVSPAVALLASFSTFAIGFFARPLGAVVFGNFGDRIGRKQMLVLALLLMGGSTTLIGLLPSYQAIGNLAPLLLIALRFVQGFALGGQWGGAVLIILENAPSDRRGWYGSFAQVGAPIGTILANLAFLIASSVLPHDDFMSWGWRVPFLASVILIGLSIFIQLRLEETAAFRELKEAEQRRRAEAGAEKDQAPALEAIRRYPRQILIAAGTFIGMQASYYTLVSFALAYGTDPNGGGMDTTTMLAVVLFGAVTMAVGVFFGAALSDRIGRRPVIIAAALLLAAWMFAIFPLIDSRAAIPAALGVGLGQFLNGIIFGPLAALYTESFATRVRYSGMSLAYQLGTLVGGALAPLIATALFARYQSSIPIASYVALMCLVSALSAWLIRETYTADIREDDGAAESAGAVPAATGPVPAEG